ncbi:OLC1v1020540C1 [Oldenlandia corymbosa var. corymbosa]|uniref:OLC1v1020540C1 n=1 Tax=Oldenlandia corymbosa var. corymbosa TaxID=529605 RepID=A0AAV1EH74_OLDCO|nr:OLC1v1020540C1 [Oldenlandia corymbosa var. corymbosa]
MEEEKSDISGVSDSKNSSPIAIRKKRKRKAEIRSTFPPTRFKGVVFQPSGHWDAQIYYAYERIWLGTFKSHVEAAMAYDSAAIKLHGENSQRNFLWTSITIQEPVFQSHFSTSQMLAMIKDGLVSSKKLFLKKLTLSDVGQLNRLVIPKRCAMRHFPQISKSLIEKEHNGMVDDVELEFLDGSMRSWKFRYCYWKSSQSFVFSRRWNKFVRYKGLRGNDMVIFSQGEYKDAYSNEMHSIFMIDASYHHDNDQLDVGGDSESKSTSRPEEESDDGDDLIPEVMLPTFRLSAIEKLAKWEESLSIQGSCDLNVRTLILLGNNPFVWSGPKPVMIINDPKLMKEILLKPNLFPKSNSNPLNKYLAQGLFTAEGDKWTKHRKLMNPAFHVEKIKVYVTSFSIECRGMLAKWEKALSPQGSYELDVWPSFQTLTSDVISRTTFGSSNFKEGGNISDLQREHADHFMEIVQSLYLPGLRFLPTKRNRRMKEINRVVKIKTKEIIDRRIIASKLEEKNKDEDLLGILNQEFGLSIEDVIEECRLFYFAGQETTSTLLVWTLILLSKHRDWQSRAREEVLQIFGTKEIHMDGLNQLKVVTMILNEVLRLYPSAPVLFRRTHEETKLGKFNLPSGVLLALQILILHHDPEIWGDDAKEFKPERFKNRVSNATTKEAKLGRIFFFFLWELNRAFHRENFPLLLLSSWRILTNSKNFLLVFLPSYFSGKIPFNLQTIKNYGKNSFIWLGPKPIIIINQPELVKEIFQKPNIFQKGSRTINPLNKLLVGLFEAEGDKWVKHRKLINPVFHMEKIKLMLPAFRLCANEMLAKWEEIISPQGSCDSDVWPFLQILTSDAISHTAFGCDYEDGKKIFQLQKELADNFMTSYQSLNFPGSRFLPTKKNRRANEIEKIVQKKIKDIIDKRMKTTRLGDDYDKNDLLGILLESNAREIEQQGGKQKFGLSIEDVIEECKLFYFAGQETTSTLLVWTMILLSKHQDWQSRARDEVLQVFGKNEIDFDGLNQLKVVTMILNEVLRLYPSAPIITRVTNKETKLGEFNLPARTVLSLQLLMLHRNDEIWGNDAKEFNPDRFKEGISNAVTKEEAHQLVAFLPFGWGPRICIGQNFAMVEAKMALAMILRRFSFQLSPSYTHAPHMLITLQPQLGANLILHKL